MTLRRKPATIAPTLVDPRSFGATEYLFTPSGRLIVRRSR